MEFDHGSLSTAALPIELSCSSLLVRVDTLRSKNLSTASLTTKTCRSRLQLHSLSVRSLVRSFLQPPTLLYSHRRDTSSLLCEIVPTQDTTSLVCRLRSLKLSRILRFRSRNTSNGLRSTFIILPGADDENSLAKLLCTTSRYSVARRPLQLRCDTNTNWSRQARNDQALVFAHAPHSTLTAYRLLASDI